MLTSLNQEVKFDIFLKHIKIYVQHRTDHR
jgi:hypothetical protein